MVVYKKVISAVRLQVIHLLEKLLEASLRGPMRASTVLSKLLVRHACHVVCFLIVYQKLH